MLSIPTSVKFIHLASVKLLILGAFVTSASIAASVNPMQPVRSTVLRCTNCVATGISFLNSESIGKPFWVRRTFPAHRSSRSKELFIQIALEPSSVVSSTPATSYSRMSGQALATAIIDWSDNFLQSTTLSRRRTLFDLAIAMIPSSVMAGHPVRLIPCNLDVVSAIR